MCVCVYVYPCVCQYIPRSSDTQTLVTLWFHLQDICKASERDLVHRGGMTDKLDLELGLFDEDSGGEMYGDQIVI